jgi:hypothetical protein
MNSNYFYTHALLILKIIQGLALLIMLWATMKFFKRQFQKNLAPILLWLILPLFILTGSIACANNNHEQFLKQRLSQQWQWKSNNSTHTLNIDAFQEKYTYQNKTGNTTPFKCEKDLKSGKNYCALYLFDYPKSGYTAMVSIDGLSAPKLHLSENEIITLK